MHENLTVLSERTRHDASSQEPQWQPLRAERVNAQAQQTARHVAERMRDASFVHATAEQTRLKTAYPAGWSPPSLGAGDLGMALMYGYFAQCFPEQGWDAVAHHYLGLATTSTLMTPSLFSGTSGMALTLSLASQGGKRYQKTRARLHQGLRDQVLRRSWRRPATERGVAFHDYDIVSGAAGVLASLVSIEQADEAVQQSIEHLLAYLVWLAEPGQPVGQERWYTPPELLPNQLHNQATPQGNFNCGLAHGIPGPLAALALTWLAGYRYPGLSESIAYLANWIETHQVHAPWGIDWPNCVPLEDASDLQAWQQLSPTRSAWCYGSPGIARSLWLAGQALNDDHLRQLAIAAIEAMSRRPISQRQMVSPHLCHGTAGLLQIFLRFAQQNRLIVSSGNSGSIIS